MSSEILTSCDVNTLTDKELRSRYLASLESQQRNLKLSEAITAANLRFIETGNINQMAQIILDTCMTITNSPFGLLYELLPNGNAAILALSLASFDAIAEEATFRDIQYDILRYGQYVIPRDDSLLFASITEDSVIIVDALEDNRWSKVACPVCSSGFSTFAGIPLKIGGNTVGLIALANRANGYWSANLHTLDNFTQTCSLSIISARSDIDRKLAQDQLRQAQKMEAIGQLAGGIAHDFNNLLTVINGYSTLVLQKIDASSQVHKDVEQILNAGERAATLVRQLLAFGRRQILEPRQINVNTLVASLHKILCRLIGEQATLTTRLAPDIGFVKADHGQVEQIVMNLVINARDALVQGGSITIETANIDLDASFVRDNPGAVLGSYIMIAVRDSGMGMSPEVIERIFEPFFTTKDQGYGTGLGLATVYGIVKQSSGYIKVISEIGIGSEFRVFLPRCSETTPRSPQANQSANTKNGAKLLQVLVVEDEPAVLNLAAVSLESRGFNVLTAPGPEEALKVFQRYSDTINVLLTDVMMPEMNGPEMAAVIRSMRPDLPVVFMSGYANENVNAIDLSNQLNRCIMKPFSPDDLARVITSCCNPTGTAVENIP
jgi:signal transduction histidine kinase/ActR/RegA family two-component response regulator